jgi:hypothetical protein
MTLAEIRGSARQKARVTTSQVSDADFKTYVIQPAIREFSKDVGGVRSEDYLALTPRFDMETKFAFRITVTGGTNALAATDVDVTDSDAANQTGAQAATELQERIRAAGPTSLTVVWDSANYYFTIDSIDGTNITIAAPSGNGKVDVTSMFFGGTGASAAQTYVADVPLDMGLEADLPADFKSMIAVEWDRDPLNAAPHSMFVSPETSGDPTHYVVISAEGESTPVRRIRLYPTPEEQKLFHVIYRADASVTLASDSAVPPFDDDHHEPLTLCCAFHLCLAAEKDQRAMLMRALYDSWKNDYNVLMLNQDTQIETSEVGAIPGPYLWPSSIKVDTS